MSLQENSSKYLLFSWSSKHLVNIFSVWVVIFILVSFHVTWAYFYGRQGHWQGVCWSWNFKQYMSWLSFDLVTCSVSITDSQRLEVPIAQDEDEDWKNHCGVVSLLLCAVSVTCYLPHGIGVPGLANYYLDLSNLSTSWIYWFQSC